MNNAEKQYTDLYSRFSGMIKENSSDVMNSVRDRAMDSFLKLGFPEKKDEKFRYTDVASCFAPDYGMNLGRVKPKVNPYESFKCNVANISTFQIFTVNDSFYTDMKAPASMPEGVMIGGLHDMALKYPELVGRYYARAACADADSLVAFNTAFAQDGVFIYVPDNVVLDKPVQIVNVRSSEGIDFMANRRLLIALGRGAQAKVLVCDHAQGDSRFLSTQTAEIFTGENAVLDYYEVEETDSSNIRMAGTYVRQEAGSSFRMSGVTLTNGLTRNTIGVTLEGEGAETVLNGLVIADKKQHVDNNTVIDHKASHCVSRELFKYVLDDAAVGAFAGKVLVRPGAVKTDSEQVDKNLCLTKDARMYAQPQLEIYADDVKCSHGATVGQLDESAVFYMRQRGLSLKEARMLLMFAFAGEVIDSIKLEPLKERLHRLAELRFRGELSKCNGCRVCKK